MTSLSDFSDEERALLVSLPYKVGVWISQADDVEGESDDEHEMQALERIITEVSKHHEDMPFVHQIAQATLKSRDHWPVWENQSFHVLDECSKAMALLASRVEKRAQDNYRKTLLEIAHSVAEAWGEFDGGAGESAEGISAIVGKIAGMFGKQQDTSHAMNVSAAEDSSLAQLAAVLEG